MQQLLTICFPLSRCSLAWGFFVAQVALQLEYPPLRGPSPPGSGLSSLTS